MFRTDIIQTIISTQGLHSYLEIGVQNPEQNFNRIFCDFKVGVDPDPASNATMIMTSDEFFKMNAGSQKFDLVFIDGLHESEQVKKDIQNALDVLNPGGFVVMHDCNPSSKEMQIVPRMQSEWTGDTWKAFMFYRRFAELEMFVVDTDYGCGVITKGERPVPAEKLKILTPQDLTYENLVEHRKEWLNLISIPEFIDKFN
jgi:SAM-dependent methyltransferase